ncbi:MAG: tol-pal system YbgF family protein [bacterium]
MGYIFYELSSYEAAIGYLIDISTDFYDYPEALLAMGWASYKLQKYHAAIDYLNEIIIKYPDFYNKVEAQFVLGQCYMKLGYYDFAIREFNEIIDVLPESENFSTVIDKMRLQIFEHENKIEGLKTELLLLETKLLDTISRNIGNGIPPFAMRERDKLRKEHESLIRKIVTESNVIFEAARQIGQIKLKIDETEMQKNWRSYAEYGKVRALYLKGVEAK